MKSLIFLLVLGVAVSALEDEYQPDKNKFLIGVRRTAVITTLSTSTVTVGSTCFTKVKTSACSGKRKKRAVMQTPDVMANVHDDGIAGSMSDPIQINNAEGDLEKLVIWTTSTKTITWYSSSTKSGTTLTIAFSCSATGVSFPGGC